MARFPIDVSDIEITQNDKLFPTTEVLAMVRPIHHRMSMFLTSDAYGLWPDLDNQDSNSLQPIIKHQIHTELKGVPVYTQVNSARNNDISHRKSVQTEFDFKPR